MGSIRNVKIEVTRLQKCHLCPKHFEDEVKLQKHFRQFHEMRCPICEKEFDSQNLIKTHIEQVHEGISEEEKTFENEKGNQEKFPSSDDNAQAYTVPAWYVGAKLPPVLVDGLTKIWREVLKREKSGHQTSATNSLNLRNCPFCGQIFQSENTQNSLIEHIAEFHSKVKGKGVGKGESNRKKR